MSQLAVYSPKTGEQKTVIESGADGRYIATGHLVYADGGIIFAVRFDLPSLAVIGGAASVLEGVRRALGGGSSPGEYAFSDNGSLVYVPGPATPAGGGLMALSVADRNGLVEPLKLQPGSYGSPRVSPDGSQLAFETSDTRETNIWLYDLSGTSAARRITSGSNNRYPVWARDSRRIYFQSDRGRDRAIFSQGVDGGLADRLTTPETGVAHVPNSASTTDDVLLFDINKGTDVSLWTLSLRDGKLSPFAEAVSATAVPSQAVFSPNGGWVAYQVDNLAAGGTFVESFPPKRSKFQIGTGGRPLWSRDGTELFFVPGPGQFAAVGVKTQPSFTWTNPVPIPRAFGVASPIDLRPFDVTRDGKFIVLAPAGGGSTNSSNPQMIFVLNWFEELKHRVPVN